MKQEDSYSINTDIKYGYSTLIDVPEFAASIQEKWFNQSLTQVNDCVVRLGVVQGEFHWHKHEEEDEFFFVLEGKLFLEFEDKKYELLPHQGYTVPKGVVHRTRAEERTIMLMIEKNSVEPTGDD